MSENQFQVLSESAVPQSQIQGEDSLVNLRSTGLQRLQATRRADNQGIQLSEGVSSNTIPPYYADPTFFQHSLSVSATSLLDSQSVGNFELGTGDF